MRATVHTTTDRIEAHALLALLQSDGIDAELTGVVDAARVGVGENALPIAIEVPAEDESRARELLAAPPDPPSEPADEPARLKKPIIAMGISVVWPGLGHLYAGRPYTAVVLGLGVVCAIVGAAAASASLAVAALVLVVADAFFGRRAVLAQNSGRRRSVVAQLAAGAVMVGGAFLLAGGTALHQKYERVQRERELSRISVRCPEGRVVVTNVGDEARDVEVTAIVGSRQMLMGADDIESVQWSGPRRGVLPTAAALELLIARPQVFLGFAMPGPSGLRVDFVSRRSTSDPGVRGSAYCVPGA